MDGPSFILVVLLTCPLVTFGRPVGGKYEFDMSIEVRMIRLSTVCCECVKVYCTVVRVWEWKGCVVGGLSCAYQRHYDEDGNGPMR